MAAGGDSPLFAGLRSPPRTTRQGDTLTPGRTPGPSFGSLLLLSPSTHNLPRSPPPADYDDDADGGAGLALVPAPYLAAPR